MDGYKVEVRSAGVAAGGGGGGGAQGGATFTPLVEW